MAFRWMWLAFGATARRRSMSNTCTEGGPWRGAIWIGGWLSATSPARVLEHDEPRWRRLRPGHCHWRSVRRGVGGPRKFCSAWQGKVSMLPALAAPLVLVCRSTMVRFSDVCGTRRKRLRRRRHYRCGQCWFLCDGLVRGLASFRAQLTGASREVFSRCFWWFSAFVL